MPGGMSEEIVNGSAISLGVERESTSIVILQETQVMDMVLIGWCVSVYLLLYFLLICLFVYLLIYVFIYFLFIFYLFVCLFCHLFVINLFMCRQHYVVAVSH